MFRAVLINPLFNLLLLIYALVPGGDFGIAVIIFTVLVRLALWPIIKKQLHSQRAMQDLAPEIAKVKEKAKGDKQLEGRLLMEMYKAKGVSPFASMVPVLIQLPLFIALFVVLKDIVEPGKIAELAYGPLRDLGMVKRIITDGSAFKPSLLGLIDMTKPNVLLAITAGLAQFWQTKQIMPKKQQPGQPNMNFMTYMFPVLTAGIALSLPAALALYWTATSAIAVWQQSLVLKRDVEEMEEQPKVVVKQKSTAQATKPKKKKKK